MWRTTSQKATDVWEHKDPFPDRRQIKRQNEQGHDVLDGGAEGLPLARGRIVGAAGNLDGDVGGLRRERWWCCHRNCADRRRIGGSFLARLTV